MAVLASMVAIYAAIVLLVPTAGPPLVAARRATLPWSLIAHLAGGLFAIAVGPWQFSTRLRRRALSVHRWTGRTYIVAVMVSGLGALSLARVSEEGMLTHLGFGTLALVWLGTTAMAYVRIRARDIVSHRQWMVRSYALTLAAVTLRIYLPISLLAGISYPVAYRAISWLCWMPNLFAAEWINRTRGWR